MPAAVCPTIDFGPHRIDYDERVLRPRPWTLLQSEWAHELDADLPAGPVLELCSGAGHIGIAAVAPNQRHLVQVDSNPAAVELSARNAERAELADRIEARCADLSEAVRDGETFALVLADPPYLPSSLVERHPDDPVIAIDGGRDGMDVLRACLAVIDRSLAPGGAALIQVFGAAQAEALAAELPAGLALHEIREHDPDRAVALVRRTPSRTPSQEHLSR